MINVMTKRCSVTWQRISVSPEHLDVEQYERRGTIVDYCYGAYGNIVGAQIKFDDAEKGEKSMVFNIDRFNPIPPATTVKVSV